MDLSGSIAGLLSPAGADGAVGGAHVVAGGLHLGAVAVLAKTAGKATLCLKPAVGCLDALTEPRYFELTFWLYTGLIVCRMRSKCMFGI